LDTNGSHDQVMHGSREPRTVCGAWGNKVIWRADWTFSLSTEVFGYGIFKHLDSSTTNDANKTEEKACRYYRCSALDGF